MRSFDDLREEICLNYCWALTRGRDCNCFRCLAIKKFERENGMSVLKTYKDERRIATVIKEIFQDMENMGFSMDPKTQLGKLKKKWLSFYD